MESIKVRFNDLYPYSSGCQIVFDLMRDLSRDELQALYDNKDNELELKWDRYREPRSSQANKYFHKLVTLIADKTDGSTNTSIKNRLIREYGQYQYINDKIPLYCVNPEFLDYFLNESPVHYKPEGMEGDRVCLAIMRGSHTYNTKEMSRLIEGAVEHAKALDIETLPPDDLKRMLEAWKPRKAAGL